MRNAAVFFIILLASISIGDVCDFNQSRDRTNTTGLWYELQDAFVCGMKEWQTEAIVFIPIALILIIFLVAILAAIYLLRRFLT